MAQKSSKSECTQDKLSSKARTAAAGLCGEASMRNHGNNTDQTETVNYLLAAEASRLLSTQLSDRLNLFYLIQTVQNPSSYPFHI